MSNENSTPKYDVNGMVTILNRLRDVNENNKMWDRLANINTLEDRAYNNFFHKEPKQQ